jgi:hypothetical protein
MAYRKSNDNWKQMLIRLDEMGERAFFMHLLVTRWTNRHVQEMRTSSHWSGLDMKSVFYYSIKGSCDSLYTLTRFEAIYRDL